MHRHDHQVSVEWTGDRGTGTSGYRHYDRNHVVRAPGKHDILASADAAFRGDPDLWNAETLLLAALAECHMLWFLHLAADAGIIVTAYFDDATAVLAEQEDGAGQFVEATLRPRVTTSSAVTEEKVAALHEQSRARCFIARSVNFPVHHRPSLHRAEED